MPFHVRITHRDPLRRHEDTVVLDKDEDWLEREVVEPRREGRPMFLGGKVIEWDDVDKIHITETREPSSALLPRIRAELSASSWVGDADAEWHLAKDAPDVTEDFLSGPPGRQATKANEPRQVVDPAAVMVVHGQDQEANSAMFSWLRAIGLRPREFSQLVLATEKGSPFIGEILELAFEQAQAVLVLFTPDETVALRPELSGMAAKWRLQARPNVLLEAGMALATDPDRTVLVLVGDQELPSDLQGRHFVRIDGPGALSDLAQRLQAAGCPVDTSGTDWLNMSLWPDRSSVGRPAAASDGAPDRDRQAAYSKLLTTHGAMVQANTGEYVSLQVATVARFRFDEAQSAVVVCAGPAVRAAAEELRKAWQPIPMGKHMAEGFVDAVEEARERFLAAVQEEQATARATRLP